MMHSELEKLRCPLKEQKETTLDQLVYQQDPLFPLVLPHSLFKDNSTFPLLVGTS